jgi:cell division transport system permease protein
MAISFEYVARETAQNLWRNRLMALAAILTVAVSLSLVGAALLFSQGAKRQLGQYASNVSLQIFLNSNASKAQIAAVQQQITAAPQIAQPCAYLDHQQSYNQAKVVLKQEPSAIDVLTPATTPTVFECKAHSPAELASLRATFRGMPGVYDAVYPASSVRAEQSLSSWSQVILIGLAVILLISSLVLILNAIRMAIFSRRREIGVMKLVGATNWFIRVPFMLEGLVQGFLGGAVAVGVVVLFNFGLDYAIRHYHVSLLSAALLSAHDVAMTGILLVIVGIAVGVLGSGVAVRRFLDV